MLTHGPPRSPLFPYTTLFRSPYPRTPADWSATQKGFAASSPGHRDLHKTSAGRRISALEPHNPGRSRSEEHTSELQSRGHLVCRLLLEKKNKKNRRC